MSWDVLLVFLLVFSMVTTLLAIQWLVMGLKRILVIGLIVLYKLHSFRIDVFIIAATLTVTYSCFIFEFKRYWLMFLRLFRVVH